ncbi:MAG: RNA polymerase factor sigma-54 [Xanthomonadaceae bacterium]|nr:RNA polymerase factor sigma-54 [Xanthomonadaceae bacterium]
MKQSIQLRLGQHLTMTPQLQQAIRLLQLSTLELQLEVQTVLDSNLMLEPSDSESMDDLDHADSLTDANAADEKLQISEQKAETDAVTEMPERPAEDTMPDELALDSSWEDTFDMGDMGQTSYSAPGNDDNRDFLETHSGETEDLYQHLMWQLGLTPFSDRDRLIATSIIDSINDDGYLGTDIEDIHQGLVRELGEEADLELDEVEAVLHRIQQFDPLGVGARDPAECLGIQLAQLDPATPWVMEARQLAAEHLNLLANRDYTQLMRRMKLAEPELRQVIELIQSMNPRPGSQLARNAAQYVVPDVFVTKRKGQWVVELNTDAIPRLRINQYYASLVRRADNSEDNNYLRNHLQEARWFLKSLQSRHETLLKVARCIVDRQHGFFEYGDEAMKPLVLRDIAETVEMHESTISRVTTQKYMHTPRGIFEFKFFFSSHVGTADGGECSATAIRAIIKKLVAAENTVKPLSDSKIADLLADQGINVARRTVAKYREAMSIPPSNERKRLA